MDRGDSDRFEDEGICDTIYREADIARTWWERWLLRVDRRPAIGRVDRPDGWAKGALGAVRDEQRRAIEQVQCGNEAERREDAPIVERVRERTIDVAVAGSAAQTARRGSDVLVVADAGNDAGRTTEVAAGRESLARRRWCRGGAEQASRRREDQAKQGPTDGTSHRLPSDGGEHGLVPWILRGRPGAGRAASTRGARRGARQHGAFELSVSARGVCHAQAQQWPDFRELDPISARLVLP